MWYIWEYFITCISKLFCARSLNQISGLTNNYLTIVCERIFSICLKCVLKGLKYWIFYHFLVKPITEDIKNIDFNYLNNLIFFMSRISYYNCIKSRKSNLDYHNAMFFIHLAVIKCNLANFRYYSERILQF